MKACENTGPGIGGARPGSHGGNGGGGGACMCVRGRGSGGGGVTGSGGGNVSPGGSDSHENSVQASFTSELFTLDLHARKTTASKNLRDEALCVSLIRASDNVAWTSVARTAAPAFMALEPESRDAMTDDAHGCYPGCRVLARQFAIGGQPWGNFF